MPVVSIGEEVENTDPNVDITEETNTQETETQVSPDESRAREAGWRPQDEWEGDPDDWVSAKEFNKRGELIERIRSQSKQLKSAERKMSKLETAVKYLGEHNQKIAEIEKKKIMDDLNKQKYQAIADGDHEQAAKVDELLEEVKSVDTSQSNVNLEEDDVDPKEAQMQAVKDAFESWVTRPENSWYMSDKTARSVFNTFADEVANENPKWTLNQILDEAKVRTKQELPGKFTKPSKKTVESSESSGGRKPGNKISIKSLPEEAQIAFRETRRFVDISEQDFIKQYQEASGEI